MKDQLISEILKQLNITETAGTESLCKAIYSATGKMALASIWDHPEDENFVWCQCINYRWNNTSRQTSRVATGHPVAFLLCVNIRPFHLSFIFLVILNLLIVFFWCKGRRLMCNLSALSAKTLFQHKNI